MKLQYLEDTWDKKRVGALSEAETLCYRSNLLGSDLRITNFGGGNTSSKIKQADNITGKEVEVLWVKGSGGDLGTITTDGFARLYMSKFMTLKNSYRGKAHEDDMVEYYPLCRFGLHSRPASIDTPLHGLIPYKHVDHTHPDWSIALAASANGQDRLREFNEQFEYHLFWLPWQRPGYHLGTMLEDEIQKNPDAEGAILASHGLINWADEQYDCYRRTIDIIDAMGKFIQSFRQKKSNGIFGGAKYFVRKDRTNIAAEVFPYIRGSVGSEKPVIGTFSDVPDVLQFVNNADGEKLAYQGTSCPDHFVRTRVRPLFVNWDPGKGSIDSLTSAFDREIVHYRSEYKDYYESNKEKNSPLMRGSNPTIVLIPGLGMFSFGKNMQEARRTGEFYINAIHVIEGATSLANDGIEDIDSNLVVNNYTALEKREAFRIEYWLLEEAKIRRQPAERRLAGHSALVVGGGSGIGREFCFKLAENGAHVAIADLNVLAAHETEKMLQEKAAEHLSYVTEIDMTNRKSVQKAIKKVVLQFGGIDILINTAAIFTPPAIGDTFIDETWDKTFSANISSNFILTEEFARIVGLQNSEASVLLTSSANAVAPKSGSEPYDVSKAAVSHLIRELAIRYAPNIRVNGISPATVVEGSSMFSRDRVEKSLQKYGLHYDKNEKTTELVKKLADFYAQRTLIQKHITPEIVVDAGFFLICPDSRRTTGHIIPVDGGLTEAFLR